MSLRGKLCSDFVNSGIRKENSSRALTKASSIFSRDGFKLVVLPGYGKTIPDLSKSQEKISAL